MNQNVYLAPKVIQSVGLGVFLFFVGLWVFTDRVEPTLLGFAGGLIAYGVGQGFLRSLQNPSLPPSSPPPPTPPPLPDPLPEDRRG